MEQELLPGEEMEVSDLENRYLGDVALDGHVVAAQGGHSSLN